MESEKPWSKERLPIAGDRVRYRLRQLFDRLGNAELLDGAFSAGGVLMVSVLFRPQPPGMPEEYPNLAACVARGEEPRLRARFRQPAGA